MSLDRLILFADNRIYILMEILQLVSICVPRLKPRVEGMRIEIYDIAANGIVLPVKFVILGLMSLDRLILFADNRIYILMEILQLVSICVPRLKPRVEGMRIEIYDIVTYVPRPEN
ncbi:hypothetical protein DPMN_053595 [Dreissena polymorpha]|uniref:Uncharacterized protein n=1 Tax=Dreissena polymorpha TaxID=45954 RepID=A0A9D4CP30_DREPO|nr:hypothetical protein DPMN_053595 [Dreissena polymorpha]